MRSIWILAVVLVTSCAGYSIEEGGKGEGYDVYQPEPYLLREPITGSGGVLTGFKFTVTWLPNYSRRYRVHSWSGFGKSDITFTFDEGWKLTGLHDKNDNSEVLKSLTDLTKHVIPANPLKIAQDGSDGLGDLAYDMADESNQPVLYKIEFDRCGQICGLKRFRVQECEGPPATRVTPIPRSKAVPSNAGSHLEEHPGTQGKK